MHDQDTVPDAGPPPTDLGPTDDAAPVGDEAGGSDETFGIDLGEAEAEISADIASISAERDEYLAVAQRLQAEFDNYRKRVGRELAEKHAAGMASLADQLLPVLDACDSALIQGVDGVAPIHKLLFEALTKEGLEVIVADDTPFDPNLHDAVMHEPAGDADAEPTVAETLRTGYLWHGRVLRPAMVKVRG